MDALDFGEVCGSGAARRIQALLAAIACILVAACAGPSLPVMSASEANGEVSAGYSIDAGDRLKITVFDEDSLSGEFDVGAGGTLAMPLLDTLVIRDMVADEVASLIEKQLLDGGYVLYPRVSVELLERRSFFILGEVTAPGEYAHSSEMTLEQAVAKAGGYTPRAEKDVVILRRQNWKESRIIRLERSPLKIAPGDTITVREAFF